MVQQTAKNLREALEVSAVEEDAQQGKCLPHRFRWHGKWYHTNAVICQWQHQPTCNHKREYTDSHIFCIQTTPNAMWQIYYDRSPHQSQVGRWIVLRKLNPHMWSG